MTKLAKTATQQQQQQKKNKMKSIVQPEQLLIPGLQITLISRLLKAQAMAVLRWARHGGAGTNQHILIGASTGRSGSTALAAHFTRYGACVTHECSNPSIHMYSKLAGFEKAASEPLTIKSIQNWHVFTKRLPSRFTAALQPLLRI